MLWQNVNASSQKSVFPHSSRTFSGEPGTSHRLAGVTVVQSRTLQVTLGKPKKKENVNKKRKICEFFAPLPPPVTRASKCHDRKTLLGTKLKSYLT